MGPLALLLQLGCPVPSDTGDSVVDSVDSVPDSARDSSSDSADSATGPDSETGPDTVPPDSGDTADSSPPAPDLDEDGYGGDVDCDDQDARVNPGASEICDLVDNDCDGSIDGLSDCREQPVEQAAWATYFGAYEGASLGGHLPRINDVDADGLPDLVLWSDYGYASDGSPIQDQLVFLSGATVVPGESAIDALEHVVVHEDFGEGPDTRGATHADLNGDGEVDMLAGGGGGPAAIHDLPSDALNDASETLASFLYQSFGSADYAYDEGVADVSDLDQDGVAEIIMGWSPNDEFWGTCYLTSELHVHFGPISQERDPDFVQNLRGELVFQQDYDVCPGSSEQEGRSFGKNVTARSDMDGDGFPDLFIHAADDIFDLVLSDVLTGDLGTYQIEDTREATWRFVKGSSGLSIELESGGDLDGDGYEDVVVGDSSTDGTSDGQVWILPGRASGWPETEGDASDGTTLLGSAEENAGDAVSIVGDADGDGFRDLAVGAYNHDGDQEEAGRVYLCYGGTPGQLSSGSTGYLEDCHTSWDGAESDIQGGELGSYLSPAGDVNQDGYDDLWVAASSITSPEGHFAAGAIYLLLGFPR